MKAPVLDCCEPVFRLGVSTPGYWHRSTCKRTPGRKVIDKPTSPAVLATVTAIRSHRPLRSDTVHPACKAADADNGKPCSRCAPLLHGPGCACYPCKYDRAHADDELWGH